MELSQIDASSEDVDILEAITGRGHSPTSRPFPGDHKDAQRKNQALQLFSILAAEEGYTNPTCAILTFEKLDKGFPKSITRRFTNADFAGRREENDSLSIYEFINAISGEYGDVDCDEDVSDSNLADADNAKRARGKAQNSRNNPSSNTSQRKGYRQKSSSYATIIDIFLTLMQKLGIWIYNVLPRISVSLPYFIISMSWLEFPALGWELALNLPDLEKHGWLYWLVQVGCLMLPIYIAYVIFTDKGIMNWNNDDKTITAFDDLEADNNEVSLTFESKSDHAERNTDEDEYKDQVKHHALLLGSSLILMGAIFIGIGSGMNDGEIIGLGVLLLLGGFLYYGWERLKMYVLEIELAKYNRVLSPAYRQLRVFVCSTVMLLLLRSIYIMTISALCLTIVECIGKDDRVPELVFASLLIGPITIAFPYTVFLKGREFHQKYIEPLPAEEKEDHNKFRGWLERFSVREGEASMLEATLANLLLPFLPQYWYFSYLQLIERAVATIIVTCLYEDVILQLSLATCIEFLAGLYEFTKKPFTDSEEDFYNILWRFIAFLILLVIMLIETIGDPFSTAGDILLLLLTLIALTLFVVAIDIPRIIRVYRRSQAVKQFREKPVLKRAHLINPGQNVDHHGLSNGHKPPNPADMEDIVNIGNIGLLSPISDSIDIASTLRNALEDIPSDISPSGVIRDSFNYIQQYRLLAKCDDNEEMHDIALAKDLFSRVEPLLSLAGSRLGEAIPQSIGAYTNVTRLILSDMHMEDHCSVKCLVTLRKLEYLNLDGNLYRTQIDGLGALTQVERLNVGRLVKWDGSGTLMLTKEISSMTSLKVLNMHGSAFYSGGVSKEFVDLLYQLDECICMDGRTIKAKDGLVNRGGFSRDQYIEGRVSVAALKRVGLSAKELKDGGYVIQDLKSEFTYTEMLSAKFTEDELKSHKVKLPMNNDSIKIAIDLWCSNRSEATQVYGHISKWDTCNVTNMIQLFKNKTEFDDDISQWNVSQVTDMSCMFWGASAFNQPIGQWDVSQVTNMNGLFWDASAFNQPIGQWDISRVTGISSMFRGASAFNQPIGQWDVSRVTDTSGIFYGASAFNQPIGQWDVSQVKSMSCMFRSPSAFNQPIGQWDVSQVTDMSYMFWGASSFNQPIGQWDVLHVRNMNGILWDASAFNQPIGQWNVCQVTDMSNMFRGASAFNQPIEQWDVSQVTNISGIFYGASAFNQPIGQWDVSQVTNMSGMFWDASAFNQPIGQWDVSRVTGISSMFRGASAFNQPIGQWDVSRVTNISDMFNGASAFNQSIRQWDVSRVKDMSCMFYGASQMQKANKPPESR